MVEIVVQKRSTKRMSSIFEGETTQREFYPKRLCARCLSKRSTARRHRALALRNNRGPTVHRVKSAWALGPKDR